PLMLVNDSKRNIRKAVNLREESGLRRSIYFHRLNVLEIPFAKLISAKSSTGLSEEGWQLYWTPNSEIHLVEAGLLGDSIEQACAAKFAERLRTCDRIDEAANIVKQAMQCKLLDAFENARRHIQALGVEQSNLPQLASAISSLVETYAQRENRVLKLDLSFIPPLLGQLSLRASLAVKHACLCDAQTAREQIQPAIASLHHVVMQAPEGAQIDSERWMRELHGIAFSDGLNPYLSGFVLSLIFERCSEEQVVSEVSRRLSLGCPPDVGAEWFEGLMRESRGLLLARTVIWKQIDQYLQSLDDAGFRQALVPLRRAFGTFAPGEVRRIVSTLVTISQTGAEELKASVDVKLSDTEAEELQKHLGDLDLGL